MDGSDIDKRGTQFNITLFIFALLFILSDLEFILVGAGNCRSGKGF